MKAFRKYWLHIFLWAAMLLYFIFAPDLFALVFTRAGKPLQRDAAIPAESNRIKFLVEDLGTYIEGGENYPSIHGWAFIVPEKGETADSFLREIVLFSDERVYFFAVKSGYRNPGSQSFFTDQGADLSNLGFDALISEDTIKPGKYRIGIIFRNTATGAMFYSDKPASCLIKTPNTLKFEK
jgi:hypothetical protein